ncbi:cyclic nucleotide-binding domain-containing protein [uncultured Erythrobacter sp.]|uniref:cyclic nucleotide-binding domain-containing protein n=1 Tax=uncultured Erythrobacter sp. TaxID=263913 RepID=UPI00261570BE|nr:cyclic nucleotide-binding domain-containing protein [uncultured Erythrobacter sp.]
MFETGNWLGWLAGLALIAAMIPHQVRLIRICALVAGVLAVVHFAILEGLGVGFLLAVAFLAVNAARMFELRRRARSGVMTRDERELFDHVMQIEEPSNQNRLRDLMMWEDVEVGIRLIEQGQLDPPLIYIASGRAQIERDGAIVSECGAGEFLGEMSHISGERASASVTVTQPMRMARLDRDALGQLAGSLPEIGKALDRAFNRSLAVKVLRMNESAA